MFVLIVSAISAVGNFLLGSRWIKVTSKEQNVVITSTSPGNNIRLKRPQRPNGEWAWVHPLQHYRCFEEGKGSPIHIQGHDILHIAENNVDVAFSVLERDLLASKDN